MGRVLIRDQYEAEHWVDEGQLAYAPWRGCEVIEREQPAVEAVVVEQVPAPEPPADDKPAKPQPRKTAAAE